jgi:putative ABC transport system ATP-binding protein
LLNNAIPYNKVVNDLKDKHLIEVVNVTKTYGKNKNAFRALHDISFSIPDGASVAIVGKSGSGKSSLMHAISGLDRPEEGQVIIDGKDILQLKNKKLDQFRSRHVGFIFQSFFVQANETCFDNVSLPLEIAKVPRKERRGLIERALGNVDLSDKIKSRARNLSGGQKQRLAIARAIVNTPALIFADEPTGNLDTVTGDLIEDLLFNYNRKKGVTLIIVTHDPELALKCDMLIFLKDGKIERIKYTKQPAKPSNDKPLPPQKAPAPRRPLHSKVRKVV